MRFLIKLIMKIHSKIWWWFKAWGERQAVGKACHFSNAFCNSMDNPSTLIPFLAGSLMGREFTKPEGGSWVPLLWRCMFLLFFVTLFIDFFISIFALLYIAIIVILLTPFVLLPLKIMGFWGGGEDDGYGYVNVEYLRNIWIEVVEDHENYVMLNVYVATLAHS